jgi:hypothetical protein
MKSRPKITVIGHAYKRGTVGWGGRKERAGKGEGDGMNMAEVHYI